MHYTKSALIYFEGTNVLRSARWDDWVPEDRLRKLTDDNKELAKNLKKEMDSLRQRAAPKAATTSSKKKIAGSDLSSARGSEERNSSVPATGRGQKRGRDYEIEKVGDHLSHFYTHSSFSMEPDLESSQEPSGKRKKTVTALHSRSISAPPRLGLVALSKQDGNAISPSPTDNRDPKVSNYPLIRQSSAPDLGLAPDSSSIPRSIASKVPTRGRGKAYYEHDILGTGPQPSARDILQPEPGAHGSPGMLFRTKEYPTPGKPTNPWRIKHKQYLKVNYYDPHNGRKAYFFQDQYHGSILMLAGVPAETGIPGPDPNKPPPIGAASAKRCHKKKSVVDTSNLQEEAFHSRPSIRIPVSQQLKNILVDDWENVTKSLSLVPLPSTKPVNVILTEYFDQEKGNRRLGSAEADLLEEVVAGMREYFDKCLGRILLYRFEREQYSEIRQLIDAGTGEYANKAIGDIYGAEHLCRLFGTYLSSLPPNIIYSLESFFLLSTHPFLYLQP